MSRHFKVSLCVIQNALKELVTDGFIECRGASGFFVLPNQALAQAKNEDAADCAARSPLPGKMFLSCLHHSDLTHLSHFVFPKNIFSGGTLYPPAMGNA
jgi:hypothetical protein